MADITYSKFVWSKKDAAKIRKQEQKEKNAMDSWNYAMKILKQREVKP